MEKLQDNKQANSGSSSLWLKIGCVVMVIAACLHSADKNIGGGDTWVAMACGRYQLGPWAAKQLGRTWQMHVLDMFGVHITQRDPFSSKSRPFEPGSRKDIGWVNQNWFSHVLFYKMKNAFGGNEEGPQKGEFLIVLFKFLQAILTGLFAYWVARVLGAHPLLAAATASFGMLLSRSYIDLRPNISTILFAAIMILLLAYWKKGRPKVLLWMIPLMILWANVHGGFIYAIAVFGAVVLGHLVMLLAFPEEYTDRLAVAKGRDYKYLLGMLVAIVVIPVVFSPFGMENLLHPFTVMAGKEGRIWRNVIEWRPIYDSSGFGNARPYIVFLSIFGAVSLLWFLLWFMKPVVAVGRGRRSRRAAGSVPWPKLDIAGWFVIAGTLWMSIHSRRFIFLGGVVLSPFLACMVQDIINMWEVKKAQSRQMPLVVPTAGLFVNRVAIFISFVAAVFITVVFVLCVQDIYFKPPLVGRQYTFFRKMAGVKDQPVRAIKFFDLNNIKGTVFNEWTNGGFVAFGQRPQPENGEPLCKVLMDGRAQAAYQVKHFQHWTALRVVLPEKKKSHYIKLCRENLDNIIQRLNLSGQENPQQLDKKLVLVAQRDMDLYKELAAMSVCDPGLYSEFLKSEGVDVALLSRGQSQVILSLMSRSGDWEQIYTDNRYVIMLRKDSNVNRNILGINPEDVRYPDDFSRRYSVGYRLCHSDKPAEQRKGLALLVGITYPHYAPGLYKLVFEVGVKLKQFGQLRAFLKKRYLLHKKQVDSGQRFDRLENCDGLLVCCSNLRQLARAFRNDKLVDKYDAEIAKYTPLRKKLYHELANDMAVGWFW